MCIRDSTEGFVKSTTAGCKTSVIVTIAERRFLVLSVISVATTCCDLLTASLELINTGEIQYKLFINHKANNYLC